MFRATRFPSALLSARSQPVTRTGDDRGRPGGFFAALFRRNGLWGWLAGPCRGGATVMAMRFDATFSLGAIP